MSSDPVNGPWTWVGQQEFEQFTKTQLFHHLVGVIEKINASHGNEQNTLEQKFVSLFTSHKLVQENLVTKEKENESLKLKIEELSTNLRDRSISDTDKTNLVEEMYSQVHKLTRDKLALTVQVEKKEQELKSVNHTLQEKLEELTNESNKVVEVRRKLHETQNQLSDLQLLHKHFTTNHEMLTSHVEWLNNELATKSSDLLRLESERLLQVESLEVKLTELTSERDCLLKSLSSMKEQNEQLQSQLTEKMKKMCSIQEDHVLQEERMKDELSKKEKLIITLKDKSSIDNKKRIQLEHTIEGLKENLRTVASEYETQIKTQKEAASQAEDKVANLSEELSKIRDKFDSSLSGTKSKVYPEEDLKRRVRELTGMNDSKRLELVILAENRYDAAIEELGHLRLENELQKNYLEKIYHEMENMRPEIEKQQQENRFYSVRHKQLTSQLELLMQETKSKSIEMKVFKKRNSILEQQNKDLSQQIHVLLSEVSRLKAVVPILPNQEDPLRQPNDLAGDITYRDIQELQEKNKELLRTVRELTTNEQREEDERATVMLQKVVEELNNLKETREKETQQVTLIVKKNNMYQELLSQAEQEKQRLLSQLNQKKKKKKKKKKNKEEKHKKETKTQ
eukprot:TRINITY_DN10091_c0_g1_i2.p1 TRINITY_DN10091_c0_g1~~TRINITY_DN10091_c0_g1_i2.p1  ORF type:complete len:625 (-),score=178.60 TRINITY_DN10091_c0_g1_i2:112-1986(-)